MILINLGAVNSPRADRCGYEQASLSGAQNRLGLRARSYDGTNWFGAPGLPAPRTAAAGAIHDGALYAIGGFDGAANATNVYRYPHREYTPDGGVYPATGSVAGGYEVRVCGWNLGSGSDVTNVTLCGLPVASIVSQSATQVVVVAGAGVPGSGAVQVFSASYGLTVKSNAFAYFAPPTVVTLPVTDITTTNAVGGGAVAADGGEPVMARGLCWSAHVDPVLTDSLALSGTGTGVFSDVVISGLAPATLHHVRAWASNAVGVAYGADVPFGTACRIAASAGANGAISPSGTVEVAYGRDRTFTVSPEPGYRVADVRVDGTSIGPTNSLTLWTVTADHTIEAAFARDTVNPSPRYIGRWRPATVLAGGFDHSAGLKDDHSIMAWGGNSQGQTNVTAPNVEYVAVAAGMYYSLGLKADGTVVGWGQNNYGQASSPPSNARLVAIDGRQGHSAGVTPEGTIVAWGWNAFGQCDVPETNASYAAVSVGAGHTVGLKTYGGIVTWGLNDCGQLDVPEPNAGFAAVAAGYYHTAGLKSNGTIVVWGRNDFQQRNVPAPNSGFTALSAGQYHTVALRSNGTIANWGRNDYGQLNLPTPNTNFVAVAAGANHSMGLKSDGSIICWGGGGDGRISVPPPNAGYGQDSGVVPSRGTAAGGTTVAIYGVNLCQGGDVTAVTLCGVVAAVVTASADRVVVVTGAAPGPTNGSVVVWSDAYGPVARSNAFSYFAATHAMTAVAGPHGSVTPTSTNVAGNADVPFTIAPDPWFHIEAVRTNETLAACNWGSSPQVFVWSNVTGSGTVRVSFAENVAPLGTPEWWLASHGWKCHRPDMRSIVLGGWCGVGPSYRAFKR
jgi:hypothetical protein